MNAMRLSKKLLHPAPLLAAVFLLSLAATARADSSVSYTGALPTPESVFETSFTLADPATVTFQTWGFGGGTNAAGAVIPAGGFDPLIALFSGPVGTATIYTDSSGNPLADADNLFNLPWSYVGNCPPAGTVAIGADQDCGDDFMRVALLSGTYTLVLTDANYIPNAIDDNGALSEGFSDFTSGAFQTCDPVANACIAPDANYAVDIKSTSTSATTATPEPSALSLLWIGLAALAALTQFKTRRTTPHMKGKSI
jgi:hypothetical protein